MRVCILLHTHIMRNYFDMKIKIETTNYLYFEDKFYTCIVLRFNSLPRHKYEIYPKGIKGILFLMDFIA